MEKIVPTFLMFYIVEKVKLVKLTQIKLAFM